MLFSRLFFLLLAVAVICCVGGFVWLLDAHVIGTWGSVSRHTPSAAEVFCVLAWIVTTTILFLLSWRQGVLEIRRLSDSYPHEKLSANFLVIMVLVSLGCGWAVLTVGGFTSRYIYPLFGSLPPKTALFLGLPFVVITLLLLLLCARLLLRSRRSDGLGMPDKVEEIGQADNPSSQRHTIKTEENKRA